MNLVIIFILLEKITIIFILFATELVLFAIFRLQFPVSPIILVIFI